MAEGREPTFKALAVLRDAIWFSGDQKVADAVSRSVESGVRRGVFRCAETGPHDGEHQSGEVSRWLLVLAARLCDVQPNDTVEQEIQPRFVTARPCSTGNEE
jgi:hypothetical protein